MTESEVNPEKVRVQEIEKMRQQVIAAVALRMSNGYHRPIEELVIPEWTRELIRAVLFQYRTAHPDGLPPPPAAFDIVKNYQRRTAHLFDAEIARQFELEAS